MKGKKIPSKNKIKKIANIIMKEECIICFEPLFNENESKKKKEETHKSFD